MECLICTDCWAKGFTPVNPLGPWTQWARGLQQELRGAMARGAAHANIRIGTKRHAGGGGGAEGRQPSSIRRPPCSTVHPWGKVQVRAVIWVEVKEGDYKCDF